MVQQLTADRHLKLNAVYCKWSQAIKDKDI